MNDKKINKIISITQSLISRISDNEKELLFLSQKKTQLTPEDYMIFLLNILSKQIKKRETKLINIRKQLIETEKDNVVRLLTSGIAHEFNNLLTGIAGYTETIYNMNINNPELNKFILKISECVEKSENLISNILNYSRIESDNSVLSEINPVDVFKDVIQLLKTKIKSFGINIDTKIKTDKYLLINVAHLNQIFINILTNAIDAIQTSNNDIKNITVIFEADKNYFYISVSDTGSGVDEKDINKLFLPFYSTKGAYGNGKISGTGLGLYITSDLIKSYAGKIVIIPNSNYGVTINIKLPFDASKERSLNKYNLFKIDNDTQNSICILEKKFSDNITLKDFLSLNDYNYFSIKEINELDRFNNKKFDLLLIDINDFNLRLLETINDKKVLLTVSENFSLNIKNSNINVLDKLFNKNAYIILKPFIMSDLVDIFSKIFNDDNLKLIPSINFKSY